MDKLPFAPALGTLALLACAGCAALPSTTPQWDARFGAATRAAFAQQVLNPDAARAHVTVDGIDGASAAQAQQRYRKSFAEPPAPATFTIGVSGTK
ncbi:hypothetical protein [Pseudoduganella armeniaca]|uniref:Lipoprotein n=1 Tax=Pseudoduganella armeniaca TaxID=2072590 RepID=A0A2R4CH26_9BURK|nr:hypothetical protein [Pseudoduganella armeniaca]AVR98957.1 hypothetical protein C9I28_27535 [Pseudoduganella armeniaca]